MDIPDLYQLLVHEIGKTQFEGDGIVGDLGSVKSTAQERPVRAFLVIITTVLRSNF